jgi:hypothetical protein
VACSDWLVRVPRGPVKGCHVAPHYWLLVLIKNLDWPGFEIETTRWAKDRRIRANQHGDRWYLLCNRANIYLN